MRNYRDGLIAVIVLAVAAIWVWHGWPVLAQQTTETGDMLFQKGETVTTTFTTTFPVTNTAVNGIGSLRQEIGRESCRERV